MFTGRSKFQQAYSYHSTTILTRRCAFNRPERQHITPGRHWIIPFLFQAFNVQWYVVVCVSAHSINCCPSSQLATAKCGQQSHYCNHTNKRSKDDDVEFVLQYNSARGEESKARPAFWHNLRLTIRTSRMTRLPIHTHRTVADLQTHHANTNNNHRNNIDSVRSVFVCLAGPVSYKSHSSAAVYEYYRSNVPKRRLRLSSEIFSFR